MDTEYLLLLEDRRDDSLLRDKGEKEREEAEREEKKRLLQEISDNEAILRSMQGCGLQLRVDGDNGQEPGGKDDIPLDKYNNLLLERIGHLREEEEKKSRRDEVRKEKQKKTKG